MNSYFTFFLLILVLDFFLFIVWRNLAMLSFLRSVAIPSYQRYNFTKNADASCILILIAKLPAVYLAVFGDLILLSFISFPRKETEAKKILSRLNLQALAWWLLLLFFLITRSLIRRFFDAAGFDARFRQNPRRDGVAAPRLSTAGWLFFFFNVLGRWLVGFTCYAAQRPAEFGYAELTAFGCNSVESTHNHTNDAVTIVHSGCR